MLVFLSDNGWSFDAAENDAERMILAVASGTVNKDGFADWVATVSHEKPRFELREFFEMLTPERFNTGFLALLPAVTKSRPDELQSTVREVAARIPIVRDLADQFVQAKHSGDEDWMRKVQVATLTVVTLYRCAEDLGYEW